MSYGNCCGRTEYGGRRYRGIEYNIPVSGAYAKPPETFHVETEAPRHLASDRFLKRIQL